MEVPVMNMDGKQVSTVALPADIFGIEPNTGLMHQAYVRQMANARQGTHSTKRRSEVSRTTAKMYRQKGTGRARHGSRTANLFVGGAVAHGPKPRKYTKDMPRKMRRKALLSTLSALYRDNQLVFVDKLDMTQPKTKEMQRTLTALTGSENALVLFTEGMENVRASVNNLPRAFALRVNYLNIRDLLHYPKVVVPLAALEVI
jgi:large subunit ribosomal protein L4